MRIETPQHLFIYDLAKALSQEEIILEGLMQMLRKVENRDLKEMLSSHETQTRQHIANLNEVFSLMGGVLWEPKELECYSAEALAKEYNERADSITSPELRDFAAAEAALKIAHFGIATYKDLRVGAEELQKPRVMDLVTINLQQTEDMAQRAEEFCHRLAPTHGGG